MQIKKKGEEVKFVIQVVARKFASIYCINDNLFMQIKIRRVKNKLIV